MADKPRYDLSVVQAQAAAPGTRSISNAALRDCVQLGMDVSTMWRCIQALKPAHFYKTMESTVKPGLWQDVYKLLFAGHRLYVKVQLLRGGSMHVISFKEDTSL